MMERPQKGTHMNNTNKLNKKGFPAQYACLDLVKLFNVLVLIFRIFIIQFLKNVNILYLFSPILDNFENVSTCFRLACNLKNKNAFIFLHRTDHLSLSVSQTV